MILNATIEYTNNTITITVTDSKMWEGRQWDEFSAMLYHNGTFLCNVTLPTGIVNDGDTIVVNFQHSGRYDIQIIRDATGSLVGTTYVIIL